MKTVEQVAASSPDADAPVKGAGASSLTAVFLGVAAVAAVAGIRHSPMSPTLPEGAEPLAIFRWAARSVGLASASSTVAVAAAFASVGIACLGFLYVLRQAWLGRLSLRAVIIAGLLLHAVAVFLPVLGSHDVFLYQMYGRIAGLHHANPYVSPPSQFPSDPVFPFLGPDWHHLTSLYGPAFIQLATLFAKLFRSSAQLIWAFKIISAAASAATVIVVASLVRRVVPRRAAFATALIALNPVVLFSAVGGGHFDPLIGLSIALAAWLMVANPRGELATTVWRELGATASLTLGALLKSPVAAILGVFVFLMVKRSPRGQRLSRLGMHLAVVVALSLPLALPFLQRHNPSLGLIGVGRSANRLAPASFLQFMLNVFQVNGRLASITWNILHAAFGLTFLVAFGVIVRRLITSRGAPTIHTLAATWGWVLLLLFLSVPAVWPWYLVWLLPLVWALPSVPRWGAVAWSIGLSGATVVGESARYLTAFMNQERFALLVLAPGGLYLLVRLLRGLLSASPITEVPEIGAGMGRYGRRG